MSNPPLPPYSSSSSGQPGPRRFSSYASVVQAAGNAPQQQAAARPQSAAHTTAPGSSFPPGTTAAATPTLHARHPSRTAMDPDMHHHHPSLSSSWGRSAYGHGIHHAPSGYASTSPWATGLPSASSGGGPATGLAAAAAAGLSPADEAKLLPPFFIPSYLKGTRQARKLEDAHLARVAAQRDAGGRSAPSSNAGSLSTSSSSVNGHKMVPSYRGMTHDIVERAGSMPVPATGAEEAPAPLPSRWAVGSDVTGMDLLNGGTEARYSGLTKQHDEAAGVRGDCTIPRECGIFYYEVTVGTKQKESVVQISIGFSTPKVTARRMPGWEPDSYGYAADDGCLLLGNSNSPKKYGPPYGNGDVIGCGINFNKNHIFFTKNGNHLGPAITNIRHDRLYPAVGLKRAGDHVRVNFGQSQFIFDIDSLVEIEREEVRTEMINTPVTELSPPLTEPQIIHKLIAQYLAHDGYIETARAFAAEVRQEQQSLAVGTSDAASSQDLEPEEDIDAIHRQKIRSAILDGDIERALKYTTVYYPDVLRDNENIYFKLKCRKFIEMIRRCAEPAEVDDVSPTLGPTTTPATATSKTDDEYNGVFGHQMELDDQTHANGSSGVAAMETSTDDLAQAAHASSASSYTDMITRTLQYGSELKAEFDGDLRREVKKSLEETLALIGYEDPRQSPLKHLLDERERAPVAEELNRAILVSLGKSSSSAIEKVFAQTDVLLDIIGKDGGPGALIDLRSSMSREIGDGGSL